MPGLGKSGISRILARRSSADTGFDYLSWDAHRGILGAVSLAQGPRETASANVPPRMNAREELFGRDSELAVLTAFIGGTDAGAMLLEGEPGIGKTSLWRSGLIEAQRSGKRVIESTPASGETQLAFSVLSDLLEVPLRDVASHLPRPQRRSLEVALLLAEDGGEA